MTTEALNLRELVAAAVRDAVDDLVASSLREALTGASGASVAHNGAAAAPVPPADPVRRTPGETRVDPVRISDDADLDAFARRLLSLFENPKTRQDLRAGRLRFRLTPLSHRSNDTSTPARHVAQGAVTERQVKAAADAGERLVLGPRAVLTPLGREKARTLGVPIEKER